LIIQDLVQTKYLPRLYVHLQRLFFFALLMATVSKVSSSTRFNEARTAQHDVQERHEDIKRIEKTLTELMQLFNDVGFHCPFVYMVAI